MSATPRPNAQQATQLNRTAAENLQAGHDHHPDSIRQIRRASYVLDALAALKTTQSAIYPTRTAFHAIENTRKVKTVLNKLPTEKFVNVTNTVVVALLNCISEAYYAHVFGKRKDLPAIIFSSRTFGAPTGDYLALQLQPDYYAFAGTINELQRAGSPDAAILPKQWSELVQVGTLNHTKSSKSTARRLRSCRAALKRYRPDLPTVHAFRVEKGRLRLSSLNVDGITTSSTTSWVDLNSWIAHVALVYRAHSDRDLDIQYCSAQPGFHRWDVRVNGGDGIAVCPFYVGRPPGRTTFASFTVLPLHAGDDSTDAGVLAAMKESFSSGTVKGFWKMSWQSASSSGNELDLLSDLHKDGWVPGLVRPHNMRLPSFEGQSDVRPDDPEIENTIPSPADDVGRVKDVLYLGSIGQPLSQCRTPRHLAKVMYDLVETHAHLAELGVLHRDISWYNVMCNPKHFITTHPSLNTDATLPRPCINSILGLPDNGPCVLLADLDHSIKVTPENMPQPGEKTGTPMFMSVEMATPKKVSFGRNCSLDLIRNMLSAAEQHADAFDKAFLSGKDGMFMADFDRVVQAEAARTAEVREEFRRTHTVMKGLIHPPSPRHDLRHDAESIYWVFLWAFARARPRDALPERGSLDLDIFCQAMMQGGSDGDRFRAWWANNGGQVEGVFHPMLQVFEELFEWMAGYLNIPWFLYCGDDAPTPIVKADHVHIAFRRFILAFMLDPARASDAQWDMELDTEMPRYTSVPDALSSRPPSNSNANECEAAVPALTLKRKAQDAARSARRHARSALVDKDGATSDVSPRSAADDSMKKAYNAQEHLDATSAEALRLMFLKDRALWFGSGIKPAGMGSTEEYS